MQRNILVVDDEKEIVDILKYNLEMDGHNVLTAFDGQNAIEMALEMQPDLILLDIMLPEVDGFNVCKKIREKFDMPIIMLTARVEEIDAVLGLEFGADDYISKPFRMKELMSRVKANLRRSNAVTTHSSISENKIKAGDFIIDTDRYEVLKNGKVIALTIREFELFKYLATHSSQISTRETLLEKVWEYEFYGDLRTVDVTIRRLRVKIEDDPSNPDYIHIKRGIGYYFGKARE